MQKTNIPPEILQQALASATNAAEKGLSQFFTPPDFAAWCAQPLPTVRPVITDLTCGNGQLLQASALTPDHRPLNSVLLGADLDPCRANGVRKIASDLTRLYPWLAEIGWKGDCFVLNPPWRLHWHRDRLAALAESDCEAVRDAWRAVESGVPPDTIDSTIATLMIALDLCTYPGEGFLIANNNTLNRLIFGFSSSGRESAPSPPFAALGRHIWARVVIPGNPMTGLDHCKWHDKEEPASGLRSPTADFETGVIYFAAAHTTGPEHFTVAAWDPKLPNPVDRVHRMGSEIRQAYFCRENTLELWEAAREQAQEAAGKTPRTPYNVFLGAGDRIVTALSLFESKSQKTNKREAELLFKLNGQTPMELVLQRAQRDHLLHVLDHGGWRVEPALRQAVDDALRSYHAARAPLRPLDGNQRLGYLDEQDTIECKKDLALMVEVESDSPDLRPPTSDLRLIFRTGQKYSIRSQTVQVQRSATKPNSFTGEPEDLEYTGQELALYIGNKLRDPAREKDDDFEEFCFMDGKLRDGKTKISEARQQKTSRRAARWQREPDAIPIDFTLQQLTEHFIIPDVPDVATNNPDQYKRNLETLTQIESLCSA